MSVVNISRRALENILKNISNEVPKCSMEGFNRNKPGFMYAILTRQLVCVRGEQHTQSGLIVDGAAGVVGLTLLQAVGQHQSAGDVV